MVTIYTTSLTFNNSTFCPHSVFMCFVWISEQTAIIFLYSINWLVFITETGCVYCAVRTGCLYTNRIHLVCIGLTGTWAQVHFVAVKTFTKPQLKELIHSNLKTRYLMLSIAQTKHLCKFITHKFVWVFLSTFLCCNMRGYSSGWMRGCCCSSLSVYLSLSRRGCWVVRVCKMAGQRLV